MSVVTNSIEHGNFLKEKAKQLGNFIYPVYSYTGPAHLTEGQVDKHRVVIVGGGIAGLTAAADFGSRGINCILLDDNNTVSSGSRSIGQAKRSMEIWDRIGCADQMSLVGQPWSVGNICHRDHHLLTFNLTSLKQQKFPPFLTLPQYYVESFLVDCCNQFPTVEVRWLNRVKGVTQDKDHVSLEVQRPDGNYTILADWVIATDGVWSDMRGFLNIPFTGETFEDRFVIADIKVNFEFPPQRMFWFDPQFIDSPVFLLHQQREGIWRVDWQLHKDEEEAVAMNPDNANSKLRQMLGSDVEFEIQNISVYQFGARRIPAFRAERVFFASDSAHQLSPFGGGRGGNSGVQDVDNLIWKLALVLENQASESLLDSYDWERIPVADENIELSNASAEFITPTSNTSKALQQAVLNLATKAEFARSFINTGRMSVTASLRNSPLVTKDQDNFEGPLSPGDAPIDSPLKDPNGTGTWLVQQLRGQFTLMISDDQKNWLAYRKPKDPGNLPRMTLSQISIGILLLTSDAVEYGFEDHTGQVGETYDLKPGSCYLFRPDQHIVARWRSFDRENIKRALNRSLARVENEV